MTTMAISEKGSDRIIQVIHDAVCFKNGSRKECRGSDGSLVFKHSLYDITWTDTEINMLPLEEPDSRVEYDKKISELNVLPKVKDVKKTSKSDVSYAVIERELLLELTNEEMEEYIDNEMHGIAGIKEFLKNIYRILLTMKDIQNQ